MGSKKRLPQMAGGSASALSLSRPVQKGSTLSPPGARLISAIWSETSYRKSSCVVTADLLMDRAADRER
jgi:hypothetical protein